ncbi:hypothetical protein E4T50_02775 [Aureobasidium sp. EXF-12298]|nr:hypothetical protein E4T50_02775 [Aureobasidium sp. EXF-12298]
MGGMPSKPVPPSLTDKNLADLFGKVGQSLNRIVVDQYLIITKVFLITGATSGIGAELAKILYAKNATVWIAARSRTKIEATIKTITNAHPTSRGVLKSITVDFNDMTTIKPAVNTFLANASRLDVLWNNAGIMIPPAGTVTRQGYEAQLGVNALAHFLFTKLLTPILLKTAELSPKNSTRIVWVSSSAAANFAPPGGVDMSNLGYQKDQGQWYKYGTSKAAAILYASEFANRHNGSGVISLSADPGNLDTDLYRDMGSFQRAMARKLALKPAVFGAYTELFAGLSTEIEIKDNGAFVIPWGKIARPRQDIEQSLKGTEQGGTWLASRFWDWSENETATYA